MAGPQVGEAYVRLRSDTSTFKSETESGVRSSFSSLAKIAGLAFGGAAVGSVIKNSIEAAGQSQAVTQSVREEFGKTGATVLDFAKKQAEAFGSTETATNATSFALGKLFKNTGATSQVAATMTTNWEKLALALNQAKGGGVAGATLALQELQTVASGTSTRGLHELGVTITSQQIQAQALADGYLKLGEAATALSPAQKQLVTYQLAMKTLPKALQEAAAHSHDFTTEQAKLAVAWDNAKTELGTALLPQITKGTKALADWLTKMERSGRLQADFNTAAHITATVMSDIKSVLSGMVHIWDSFASAVGGSKNALYALVAAFGALKGLSISRGIGRAVQGDEQNLVGRIRAHLANVKAQVEAEKKGVSSPTSPAFASLGKAQAAHDAALKAKLLSPTSPAFASLGKAQAAHDAVAKAATASATKQIAANAAVAASVQKIGTAHVGVAESAKKSAASVEAGIQKFRTALLAGQPVPKNDAYIKALQQQAKQSKDIGPFGQGWAAEQKKNLVSVGEAARGVSERVSRTPAGAASVEAGIQKFRTALLAGQKVPQTDTYFKALQAQAQATGVHIKSSLGSASTSAHRSIASIGNAFSPIAAKAKSASAVAVDHIGRMKTAVSQFASTTTTKTTQSFNEFKTGAAKAAASMGQVGTSITNTGNSAKSKFQDMGNSFSDFAKKADQQTGGFGSAVKRASGTAASSFGAAATSMKAAAIEVGVTIKSAIIQTGIGLLVVAIGIAVSYIITHWKTVEKYTIALGETIKVVFFDVLRAVKGYYEILGGGLATALSAPLRVFLELAKKVADIIPNSIFGISTGAGAIKSGIDDAIGFLKKGTTGLVSAGAHNLTSGVTSIFGDAKHAWTKALADGAADPKTKDAAKKAGRDLGKNAANEATKTLTELAPAMTKTISDALQNAIAAAHKAIVASVQSAKDNLDKIGQELAKSIDQIQQKLGGAAGSIAGSPQGAAFLKLKKLIESGAPGFEISKAATELQSQLQNAGKTQKTQVQTQIANLTSAFDKGQISFREFESRLHKILHDDGITMAQALKAGGPAFADAVKAQIRALGQQARAISEVPRRFRGIGGAGGAADIKIIQPLQVIKQEQEKVRVAMSKAVAEAQKQRAAQLKQQQKIAQSTAQLATVGVKLIVKPTGPPGDQHHHRELLGQVRDLVRRHADAVTRPRRQPTVHVTTEPRGARGGPVQRRVTVSTAPTPTATRRPFTDGLTRVKDEVAISRTDIVRALKQVCDDIAQADKDIVAAELHVTGPLENLRRTELRIADNAARQRNQEITLQKRTNTLLSKLHKSQNARLPGYGKEPKGWGSHHARKASQAGVRA